MRHIALIIIICVSYTGLAWLCNPSVVSTEPVPKVFGHRIVPEPIPLTPLLLDEPTVVLWVVEDDGRRVRYHFRESELR